MDVVKRENSVILLEDDYNTKYQGFNPSDEESWIFMKLMQNAYLEQSLLAASVISEKLKAGPIKADRGIWQNPFLILWQTAMPAVLVELGFISNTMDLATLRQEDNRNRLADCLFEAFKDYKALYDSSVEIRHPREEKAAPAEPVAEKPVQTNSAPVKTEPVAAAPAIALYGTQIFASSRTIDPSDPMFYGYIPVVINIGSLNKYIIGVFEDPEEARKANISIKEKYPSSFMVKIVDGATSRFK